MFFSATHQTALLLLGVSFVCLGSWASLFKSSRWRYELFYFDFTAGALLFSIAAAFSLGTLGSDLSFMDRMAVAGIRSQAFVLCAGFGFGLGNLLLLAGVALSGMGLAFPLTISFALVVVSIVNFNRAHLGLDSATILFFLAAGVITAVAAYAWASNRPATTKKSARDNASRPMKTLMVGLIGGILIGGSQPVAASGLWGDLGLGPYAGQLLFTIGLAVATLVFNIFLMNIALTGTRATIPGFAQGKARQHVLGLAAGAIWGLGMLSALLAHSDAATSPWWSGYLAEGWVLLAVLWGVLRWKEFNKSPASAKTLLLVGCVLFAVAITLSNWSFAK